MADENQSKQENASLNGRGGGQVVVSLHGVSEGGLVFCSRHRFEVAAEVQLRVRREILPLPIQKNLDPDSAGWVTIRGFVIDCRVTRQSGGRMGFLVTLVLDLVLLKGVRCTRRAAGLSWRELEIFGPN